MVELRYPIIQYAEKFIRILSEGKFPYFHAQIPENVDSKRKWIQRRAYKRENHIEYNYSIIYHNTVVGGCEIRLK